MSSETSSSPEARRARIALRVGSASAAKTELKRLTSLSIAIQLYCHMAIYKSIDFRASPECQAGFRSHLRSCYRQGFEISCRHDTGVDNLLPLPVECLHL